MKTWFITGASRGFGHEWARAALERGDRVAATARELTTLDDLVAEFGDAARRLPPADPPRPAAGAGLDRAHDHFGALDVVVNNAGYGHFGMVEELAEAELRDQLEANLFGAVWVTQAALPHLRAQGSGHVVQVSSIGGISAFPGIGAYHASKWALEGISQALAQEVAAFGIHVTLVEPGAFSTDWAGPSARRSAPLPAYDDARAQMAAARAVRAAAPGDPRASAAALLAVVDAPVPPLRVFFGDLPLAIATHDYEQRLATWREWEHVSRLAQGEPAPTASGQENR